MSARSNIRTYLRSIFEEPENACDVCGAINVHDKDCPGRAAAPVAAFRESVARARREGLALVRSAPSREEFAAWRDHPVTLFVFAALSNASAEQRNAWSETSWEGGEANENLLLELRTRADAYNSMQEADYEGFCEWAGVEPEPLVEAEKEWGSL